MEGPRVSIIIGNRAASRLKRAWLAQVVEAALAHEGVQGAELALLLTGDRKIRQLHRRFLGEDRPTDVLSFPSQDGQGFVLPEDNTPFLGDVAISYPRAVEQALEAGCPVEEEVARLLVHGIFHLLGYDHATAEEEKRMRGKEEAVLERLRASALQTS